MNIRRFILPLAALFIGFSQHVVAADTSIPTTKPGYNVVLDVDFTETGVGEDARIVQSDDSTGDHLLEQIAISLAATIKQKPQLKDGKPVKFTARVPFNFPVEGDEGPAANNAPKPAVRSAQQPLFPENLVAKGENGGAILELSIGSFGNVQNVKVLNASHQEYADSAVAAVKTWIFAPAQKDGVPVECRWRIAVSFSADGKDVEWKWRLAPRPSLGGYTVIRPKAPPSAAQPAAAPTLAPITAPAK